MQVGYSSKRLMLIADYADCPPPSHGDPATKTSYTTTLCHRRLRACPTVNSSPFHQHNSSFQHIQQLSQQTSSKGKLQSYIKMGYASDPYIQQTNNRHLRKIIAQFRTGSHWLHTETGRHKKLENKDRICPMCAFRLSNPGLSYGMPLF